MQPNMITTWIDSEMDEVATVEEMHVECHAECNSDGCIFIGIWRMLWVHVGLVLRGNVSRHALLREYALLVLCDAVSMTTHTSPFIVRVGRGLRQGNARVDAAADGRYHEETHAGTFFSRVRFDGKVQLWRWLLTCWRCNGHVHL